MVRGDCEWSTPHLVSFTPLKQLRYQIVLDSNCAPVSVWEGVDKRKFLAPPPGFRIPAFKEFVYWLHHLGSPRLPGANQPQIGKVINHPDNSDVYSVTCEIFREMCYVPIYRLKRKVSYQLPPPGPDPSPRFELILGVKSHRQALSKWDMSYKHSKSLGIKFPVAVHLLLRIQRQDWLLPQHAG